LKIFFFTVT